MVIWYHNITPNKVLYQYLPIVISEYLYPQHVVGTTQPSA